MPKLNIFEYKRTVNWEQVIRLNCTTREITWKVHEIIVSEDVVKDLQQSTLEEIHEILEIEMAFKENKPYKKVSWRISY